MGFFQYPLTTPRSPFVCARVRAVLALFWRTQAAALEAESSYHHFENLTAIASAALERVRNEERWAKGQVSRGEGGAQAWAQAHYRRKNVFPPHPAYITKYQRARTHQPL